MATVTEEGSDFFGDYNAWDSILVTSPTEGGSRIPRQN